MRTQRRKAPSSLRRWPERNFLEEFEPRLAETNALDDLARKDPHLRRLRDRVVRASRAIRRAVSPSVWVTFADARLDLLVAEFELAFNLGFENGVLAARTLQRRRRGSARKATAQFTADLQRLIAGAAVPRSALLEALFDLATGLAIGATTRAPSHGRRRTR